MSDLISREALKERIDNIVNEQTMTETEKLIFEDFKIFIDNAPTVENITVFCENADEKTIEELKAELKRVITELRPKGEWVPVSERLPEYSGLYLISIYDLVTVANFTGKHFCDRQMDKFVDVIAWQPLPEPYKKGGAE